ncbi:MAG: hypothetical protein QME51_07360 [Planctomycetota bacterium]|nr:hypothetical protein [Planctomycetota bacterium]MDI6788172.1 hypothetical protein [Planctomycetota bacterium]
MVLIFLILALLCGCATAPSPKIPPLNQIQIPFEVREKSTISIIPVLLPKPEKKTEFYEFFLPSPDEEKYRLNERYLYILANKVQEHLSEKGFISFVGNPVRTEDMYIPEFFEVLKASFPSDYCILIYLYEITNSERRIGRTSSYNGEWKHTIERWEQNSLAVSRIELYESANMSLIWQFNVNKNALMITEKKISGAKALDDLVHSFIQPHYYEQVNNDVIDSTTKEMMGAFQPLSVDINPKHTVKVSVYIYKAKVSSENLLKDVQVKILNLISEVVLKRWDFVTNESGQIDIDLPEGFYQIDTSVTNSDLTITTHSVKTLVIGNVRRINITLK